MKDDDMVARNKLVFATKTMTRSQCQAPFTQQRMMRVFSHEDDDMVARNKLVFATKTMTTITIIKF